MTRTPAETLADLVATGFRLPPAELNALLQATWPLMHGPLHHYDIVTLLALFKRAGYVSDGMAYPADELTVYRGEPVASGQRGISWTTDIQVADMYAKGYSTSPPCTGCPSDCTSDISVGRFTFENEVVVEPELLKGVEVKGYRPWFTLKLRFER